MFVNIPDIQVAAIPGKPGHYKVESKPRVENVDYRLLARAYTNVSSRLIDGLATHEIVEVLGKTGALPIEPTEAALGRLVEATFHRNETDTNPPTTWWAVHDLIGVASPEALAVAVDYFNWNWLLLIHLWKQSRDTWDKEESKLLQDHAEARLDAAGKLRPFIDNSPPSSQLA